MISFFSYALEGNETNIKKLKLLQNSADTNKPTENSNSNVQQSVENMKSPAQQSSAEPLRQASNEDTSRQNSDKQREATKGSSGDGPRPQGQTTITISGDPMPLPPGAKEEGERAKNTGLEGKGQKEEGPKPGDTQSDHVRAPQGSYF